MDRSLQDFFEQEIESKSKSSGRPAEEVAKEVTLENWLREAAEKISGYRLTTHPPGFSHPNAGSSGPDGSIKTSAVIADAEDTNDGYVRSRAVPTDLADLDAFGNAALMGYYRLLMLRMDDGVRLVDHLTRDTDLSRSALAPFGDDGERIRQQLLTIRDESRNQVTHPLIKQVYFPVTDGYHQLSVLTPSLLVFRLKQSIADLRASDDGREAREAERKQLDHPRGYCTVPRATEVKYGGSKPQNISRHNSKTQNHGVAYLLRSVPPTLSRGPLRLPRHDFFRESIRFASFRESFDSLRRFLDSDVNNVAVRRGRDKLFGHIIDQIVAAAFSVRSVGSGWSADEPFSHLPKYQKTVLDSAFEGMGSERTEACAEFISASTRWIVNALQRFGPSVKYSDIEFSHIAKLAEKAREVLI